MNKLELKETIDKINEIIRDTDINNVFDSIIDFFDSVNYINDHFNEAELRRLPIKGFKGFLFLPCSEKYLINSAKRQTTITGLRKCGRTTYGINRSTGRTSKHETYVGDTHGIWTNTIWYFEHEADESTRKVIAHQIYNYLKSYRNEFHSDWIK